MCFNRLRYASLLGVMFVSFAAIDCCGAYVENDADICPTCYEHCEVIEDRVDYDGSDDVHFQASLDFYGAG